jgi:HD-like signal output (HDOD) protein
MSAITAAADPTAAAPARPWAIKSLPPFPAVAMQLLSLLDDDDVPMKQVVTLLRVDPALSAEILRVSNSALYGLSRRIDNVSHAVVVLGTESVKRLALTVALGKFSGQFARSHGLRGCWDHSIAMALSAERLADLLHQPRDRAYTAGLLADVGRLALLACYPNEYGNLLEVARENDFDLLECERQMFDIDHCAAGEWLARHWNLPEYLVEAIGLHHSSDASPESIAGIVAAADAIADAAGFASPPMPVRRTIDEILTGLPIREQESAQSAFANMAEAIDRALSAFAPR